MNKLIVISIIILSMLLPNLDLIYKVLTQECLGCYHNTFYFMRNGEVTENKLWLYGIELKGSGAF